MPRRSARAAPRSASILAGAAFAVDQVHYLALNGFSTRSGILGCGAAFAVHLVPLLLGIALAAFVAVRISSPGDGRGALRALALGIGIAAVFGSQDVLQATLLSGHPAELLSVGGWSALPLAALLGLIAAITQRGVTAVVTRVRRSRVRLARPRSVAAAKTAVEVLLRPAGVLASGLATRPPPLLV